MRLLQSCITRTHLFENDVRGAIFEQGGIGTDDIESLKGD